MFQTLHLVGNQSDKTRVKEIQNTNGFQNKNHLSFYFVVHYLFSNIEWDRIGYKDDHTKVWFKKAYWSDITILIVQFFRRSGNEKTFRLERFEIGTIQRKIIERKHILWRITFCANC